MSADQDSFVFLSSSRSCRDNHLFPGQIRWEDHTDWHKQQWNNVSVTHRYNLHHIRGVKCLKMTRWRSSKFPCCPHRCWIVDSTVHYAVNIGYYCFVFIFTFSTFIVVLRWICMLRQKKWNSLEKIKRSNTGTTDITTVMGLCCLLGLTWSFSFFSYGALRVPSYYIFTILNSFQGERASSAYAHFNSFTVRGYCCVSKALF